MTHGNRNYHVHLADIKFRVTVLARLRLTGEAGFERLPSGGGPSHAASDSLPRRTTRTLDQPYFLRPAFARIFHRIWRNIPSHNSASREDKVIRRTMRRTRSSVDVTAIGFT